MSHRSSALGVQVWVTRISLEVTQLGAGPGAAKGTPNWASASAAGAAREELASRHRHRS